MTQMNISVSKRPSSKAALNTKELSLRERFSRLLFGPQRKVIVLVPSEQIDLITITKKGDEK